MVLLGVSAIAPRWPLKSRGGIAVAIAFLVEFSQLYHAPWIDSIRHTWLGGLVLGFGFLWTDLVCYTAGIAIGLTLLHLLANTPVAPSRTSP